MIELTARVTVWRLINKGRRIREIELKSQVIKAKSMDDMLEVLPKRAEALFKRRKCEYLRLVLHFGSDTKVEGKLSYTAEHKRD